MKKVALSVLFLLTTVIGTSVASAQDSLDYKSDASAYLQSEKAVIEYVDVISSNAMDWENAAITYEFPLYDFNDNITGFLFSVENNGLSDGYVIVSSDSKHVVLESTRDGQNPYMSLKDGEKAVYVGATQYYIKSADGSYYDIRQQKQIQSSDLKSKGNLQGIELKLGDLPNTGSTVTDDVYDVDTASEIQPKTIVSYSSKKISGVPDFTWRKGCSPTSFGNIIKYWKNNGYSGLMASTTSDNTLIDVLASSSYMNTSSDGSSDWNNRVTGMTNFWKDRGYTVSVSRVSANFSTHKTEMNANRPDIINVVNDATYSNHDMTGVGFEEYQDTDYNLQWFRYVIVHDTWSNTPTDVYIYLPQLSWNETVKVVPQ